MNDLQWIGMVVSLAGAWLTSGTTPRSRLLGFWMFLLANCLWGSFAVSIGAWGMVITQALFTCTSIRGIRANLAPRLNP